MTGPRRSSGPQHPFGELLTQYRLRKPGLTQTQLAGLAGYDQAILVRMGQGKKDLTGPSGRERILRLAGVLFDLGALFTLDEVNGLLLAATMPPLIERQPAEAGAGRLEADVQDRRRPVRRPGCGGHAVGAGRQLGHGQPGVAVQAPPRADPAERRRVEV